MHVICTIINMTNTLIIRLLLLTHLQAMQPPDLSLIFSVAAANAYYYSFPPQPQKTECAKIVPSIYSLM